MGCGPSKVAVSTIQVQPSMRNDSLLKKENLIQNRSKNEETIENIEHSGLNNLVNQKSTMGMENFKQKKLKLIPSLNIFYEVDERSKKIQSKCKSTLSEIVKYLVEPFENELFKLRAIWIWITHNISYDVTSYFNPQEEASEYKKGENVLISRKAVCSGYSNLFAEMCKTVGIKVETVYGWAKGHDYKIGAKFTDTESNHAWNIVSLCDNLWLLDATWGAGYIDDNNSFVHQYSEHYFMVDPKQFIFDHFPQNPNYQLLENGITMDTFENFVNLTKHFFMLNLKPLSHTNGIIDCDTGKQHIKFRIDKDLPVKFSGNLTNEESVANDKYVHIYSTEKTSHVLVDVPKQGEYCLKVYAARFDNENDDPIPLVCTYVIKCSGKLGKASEFPKQYKQWSPGFYLHSPTDGVLHVGETYKFRITLPGIQDMAVCLGGQKSSWEKIVNTRDALWEGEITMPVGTERVNIVAKFGQQKYINTPFSSVLEYKVVEKDWS